MNATESLMILGIDKKFPISQKQLGKAYRTMAKKVHPDITGNDAQMKKVNEAHEWLKVNLDKVNEVNMKPKENTNHTRNNDIDILDMAADSFVRDYQMANTRIMKRIAISDFLKTVDKVRLFRSYSK